MAQPYDRVFNFSAGPCTLPVEVIEQARDEIMNCRGAGMSVMEMSHRSPAYEAIIAEAEADLRTLLGIPDNYKVLFLQGGASLQFSMVPLNFLGKGQTADYVTTGSWGQKAIEAARIVGDAKEIFTAKGENFRSAPDFTALKLTPGAQYVHYTSNETIQGVEFQTDPTVDATWICDMSSDILSRPVDVSKYAMIYAGAQKNMGPAGVVVAIVRDDLMARAPETMHPMLDYRIHAENGSMYNTPPCWTIYMCGLVYKWALKLGGLKEMNKRNREKSSVVYRAIDESGGFYKGHAALDDRSIMNVTFTLPSDDLTKQFLKEAEGRKLDGLKGHRSVGGCRASIYNAFPKEGCEELAAFMHEFAAKNAAVAASA